MSNYEIVYDNEKAGRRSPFDSNSRLLESQFYQNAYESFALRLSPELIARELSFFLICFAIFMYVGNGGVDSESKVFNFYVLYAPVWVAGYQLIRASFHSMIPGLICIVIALFIKYFGVNISFLKFINPKDAAYLLGAGFLILPLSFFREY